MAYTRTGKAHGPAPAPDGTVKTYTRPNGDTAQWVKNGTRWDYVPGSYVAAVDKVRKKPGKAAKINAVVQCAADRIICQNSKDEGPKLSKDSRRQTHHKARPAFCNDSNPAKSEVKGQSGGRYVKTQKGTWVYKKYDVV